MGRSLTARLVLSFLLLSLVIVACLATIAYVSARGSLETSQYERLEAVAAARAEGLDRWVDEQQRSIAFIGRLPGFGDTARTLLSGEARPEDERAAQAAIRDVLRRAVRLTSDAEDLLLLDLDGTIRAATRPEYEGASQRGARYFEDGTSRTTVQPVHTSTLTGRQTITVSAPVFDEGRGLRVGVLAANLDLERVDRIVLEGTGVGATGAVYLVGPEGRFVHRRLAVGAFAGTISSTGIDRALAGESGRGAYTDYRGVPVVGVYRWLDEHQAALVAEMSQAEAFAPADRLAVVIGLVGLAAAGLLAVGVFLVSRRIARPIGELAATASRVTAGDLEATAPVRSTDEVGILAHAFNDMTARLRANVQDLERRVDERTAELTAALDAQRAAERRYRRLVEELPLAVYMDRPGDPMDGSLYVSPRVESMFGYPAEDWLRDGFFGSIIHPDDRDEVALRVGVMQDTGDMTSGEYRLIAKDGRVVWVRDDATLVRDERGEPEYVLGFIVDVTAQTEAAAVIRRQKQYFESLVEVSPVAVVTMDREERVVGWNPAASRLFGYAADEAIGRHIDDLILRTDELRAEGHEIVRQAAASGRAQRVGRRMRRNGALVDVEILMVPLVVDGEHTGYYAIYHDISELEAARREADAANEAKSAFLAAMSHEIRTPMNGIIGMTGLLLDTSLDETQRDYAETIRTSGDALLTIINDILDFSKVEAGRMELDLAPFSVIEVVEGSVSVVAATAQRKGIGLRLVLHDAPLPRLLGDAGRTRQVVLNLLSNAVKFTEKGEVVVTLGGRPVVDATGALRSRWEVWVEVRDTGLGIPPDRMDRLFRSFSQIDASISRRFGGTGLGLAISRRLAELMNGTVTATSTGVPGEGATFRFAFHADVAVTSDTDDASPSPAPSPGAGAVSLRVLLAEDNAVNQKLATRLLERLGHTTDVVGNGLEAIASLERSSYDLVLMDVQMPELDGLEATRRIRARWPDRPIPIVAMTANAMQGDREACLAAGMDDYVSKPILPDELSAAIERATTTPVVRGDAG